MRIFNRFRWTDDCVVWDETSVPGYIGEERPLPSCSNSSASHAEGFLTMKDISFAKDDQNPWVR
jgi:hypothetical protein